MSFLKVLDESTLAVTEPRFYKIWLADQDPNDSQLERWVELEAGHLRKGKNRVSNLKKFFSVEGKEVLDVGCQWGSVSIALARENAIVTGIDVKEAFVKGAGARAEDQGVKATFLTSSAEKMPFPDNSFDVVIGLNIIEHVGSQSETVREMIRVLRPGGYLFIDGPNRFSPEMFKNDPHYQLRAVSVFPNWLGRFYITKIRGFQSYEVGVFPTASKIERLLRKNCVEIVAASRKKHKDSFISRLKTYIKFNTSPKFFLVGEKMISDNRRIDGVGRRYNEKC